jgi:hypothetical protein
MSFQNITKKTQIMHSSTPKIIKITSHYAYLNSQDQNKPSHLTQKMKTI